VLADSDTDSDSDPAVPVEREKEMRGHYRCELCPDKIILNEKVLEQHLQSTAHLKNERRFARVKEIGLEAFEAECRERAEAREARAAGLPSKKDLKNKSYWEKKRKKSKRKPAKEESDALSQAEIKRRKNVFQAKKERRLQRKGEGAPAKEQQAQAVSAAASFAKVAQEAQAETGQRLNRKARRAALQRAGGEAPAPAEVAVPGGAAAAAKAEGKRKRRRLAA